MRQQNDEDPIRKMIGQNVIIDTDSSFLYAGELEKVTDEVFVLLMADVHSNRDIGRTLEQHAHDLAHIGINPNRKKVYIFRNRVVSMSLLDDILRF